jgi:DNA-binding transcriptional ArsR family regulator
MDDEAVILGLAGLAQPTRLALFRLLVRHTPEGLAAGEIARQLAVPHNTLSAHLGVLTRAGLVHGERRSRSIVYRADLDRLRALNLYLLRDCCGGRLEVCGPLIEELTPCCTPQEHMAQGGDHE